MEDDKHFLQYGSRNNPQISSQLGFSLIELMMVLAIIGLLASIAMPAYKYVIVRSQVAEAITLARGTMRNATDFFYDRGRWPTEGDTIADDGSITPGVEELGQAKISAQYVSSIFVTNGIVTIVMGNRVSSKIAGNTVTMTPATNRNDNVIWLCSRGQVADGITTSTGIIGGAGVNLSATVPATEIPQQYLPSNCRP